MITESGPQHLGVVVIGAGFGAGRSSRAQRPGRGLDTFTGAVFHSARWNHDVDLAGRNVVVVGTGASAIQFAPAIQPRAGQVTVVQRTAPWIIPRMDRATTRFERRLYATLQASETSSADSDSGRPARGSRRRSLIRRRR